MIVSSSLESLEPRVSRIHHSPLGNWRPRWRPHWTDAMISSINTPKPFFEVLMSDLELEWPTVKVTKEVISKFKKFFDEDFDETITQLSKYIRAESSKYESTDYSWLGITRTSSEFHDLYVNAILEKLKHNKITIAQFLDKDFRICFERVVKHMFVYCRYNTSLAHDSINMKSVFNLMAEKEMLSVLMTHPRYWRLGPEDSPTFIKETLKLFQNEPFPEIHPENIVSVAHLSKILNYVENEKQKFKILNYFLEKGLLSKPSPSLGYGDIQRLVGSFENKSTIAHKILEMIDKQDWSISYVEELECFFHFVGHGAYPLVERKLNNFCEDERSFRYVLSFFSKVRQQELIVNSADKIAKIRGVDFKDLLEFFDTHEKKVELYSRYKKHLYPLNPCTSSFLSMLHESKLGHDLTFEILIHYVASINRKLSSQPNSWLNDSKRNAIQKLHAPLESMINAYEKSNKTRADKIKLKHGVRDVMKKVQHEMQPEVTKNEVCKLMLLSLFTALIALFYYSIKNLSITGNWTPRMKYANNRADSRFEALVETTAKL